MNRRVSQPSDQGTTVFFVLELPELPAGQERRVIAAPAARGERLLLDLLHRRRLRLTVITAENELLVRRTTPEIDLEPPEAGIVLVVQWAVDGTSVLMQANEVDLLGPHERDSIAVVGKPRPARASAIATVVSECEQSMCDRRSRYGVVHAAPGKTPVTPDFEFELLRNEATTLRAEVDGLALGRAPSISRLLAQLRALVLQKGANQALLLRCAAHLDAPLPLYIGDSPVEVEAVRSLAAESGGLWLKMGFGVTSGGGPQRIVDLEKWLGDPTLWYSPDNKWYTVGDVISAGADKLGAHFDRTLPDHLTAMIISVQAAEPLGVFVVSASRVVCELAEEMLSRRRGSSSIA